VYYGNTTATGTSTLQRNYQTASGSNRLQGYSQTWQAARGNTRNTTANYTQDASGALTRKGSQ